MSEPLDAVFPVTEKAMRPANNIRQCFYCHQPIGESHKPNCTLVQKKAKVRMIIDYEIEVPAFWTEKYINFHRNLGSWCADNALYELEKISEEEGCLCSRSVFEYMGGDTAPYLDE